MKLLFTLLLSVICTFSFCQKEETVHFSSIDEMLAYGKFTDSLRENFVAEDHIDSVFILLNEYRVEQGVEPVILDTNLCKVADLQATYNAEHNTVTHENADSVNTLLHKGLQYGERWIAAEVATMNHIHGLFLTKRTIPEAPMYNLEYCTAHAFIMKQPEYSRCGISIVQSETDKNEFYTIIVFATH